MRQVGSLESINIAVGETIGEAYSNVKKVADNIDEINSISPSIANINTVGNDIANVDTCATSIGDISIAASNILSINTTAGSIANVNTVAGSITNVNDVANDLTNINTVAPHVGNIDNVATNIANVNNVGNDITKVVDVANDLTNIDAVNANKTNIDIVANDKANIDITAGSIDNVNTYARTYYGPLASDPTTRPDGTAIQVGDMYFNTTDNKMKVYNGTSWGNAGSTVNGTSRRQTFTATAGQTTFTIAGGYDATFADVYLNGRKLINGNEVDVSSGTDVVLTIGASAGDVVDVVCYGAFEVANTYTKAEVDNNIYTKSEVDAGTVVLNGIKNVDGSGSGLDADTVDGKHASELGGVIGSIIAYPSSTAPSGFLECNGAAISRTTYANLYAVIGTTYGSGDGSTTFNIPDLRGEFIRGFDNGRGVDNGRNIGTWQTDSFRSHNHSFSPEVNTNASENSSTGYSGLGVKNATNYTSYAGGSETRPRNIAMMYCIKY